MLIFAQFMALLIVIFLGEIAGGVLVIIFKDSVSYSRRILYWFY